MCRGGQRVKRVAGALALLAAGAIPAFGADMPTKAPVVAESQDRNWIATFNEETRYFWSSSTGARTNGQSLNSLSQLVYEPFAFKLVGRATEDIKLEFLLRSGAFWAREQSNGAASEASGAVDTSFTSTATYYGLDGIQPFASLTVNAPTGVTVLRNAASARPDPDIMDIPLFGEGWNFGPTVGANIPITRELIVTLSAGYTGRGVYDRENPDTSPIAPPTVRINPGDVWTGNATVGYKTGPWSLQATASYSGESQTAIDNAPFYKKGDRVIVSGSVGRTWNDHWGSKFSASFSHFEKNKIFMAGFSELVLEAANSNSDVTKLTLDTTWQDGPWAAGPSVYFVLRDHNGYDPANQRFLPAKTAWSLGGFAQYAVTNDASVNVRVEHLWLREDATPDQFALVPPPVAGSGHTVIDTESWIVAFGGLIRF